VSPLHQPPKEHPGEGARRGGGGGGKGVGELIVPRCSLFYNTSESACGKGAEQRGRGWGGKGGETKGRVSGEA